MASCASVFKQPGLYTFGLYKIDCKKMQKGINQDSFYSFVTLANIISWIPFIGAIIGAIRIYAGVMLYQANNSKKNQAIATGLIGRGVIELLTLGFIGPLEAVVDAIFLFGRA